MALDVGLLAPRRRVLSRRIRCFVAVTITYNVIEAVVALAEGTRVSSAAAVAWQFAGHDPEAREKTALRIIAFSFFGLAAYVTVDSVRGILGHGEAEPSTIGIALAAVSLAVCRAARGAAAQFAVGLVVGRSRGGLGDRRSRRSGGHSGVAWRIMLRRRV